MSGMMKYWKLDKLYWNLCSNDIMKVMCWCNDENVKNWTNCIEIVVIMILHKWYVWYNDGLIFRHDWDQYEIKCLGIGLLL